MLISTIGVFLKPPGLLPWGPQAPFAAQKLGATLEFNFPPRNYSVYEISRGLFKKCGF